MDAGSGGRSGAKALRAIIDDQVRRMPDGTCYWFVAADAAEGDRVSITWAQLRDAVKRFAHSDEGSSRGFAVIDSANEADYPPRVLASLYDGLPLVALNNRQSDAEKAERLAIVEALPHGAAESAVVMFTSGSTGAPKAVPLTWDNLVGSARAANEALGGDAPDVLWQAALPLYHVGGLQVIVRSLLARRPFLLYERFDPARMIADAREFRVTHASVVDKMLRDLLDEADLRAKQGGCGAQSHGAAHDDPIAAYRCILLGGAAPNAALLARAARRGARVYASYGLTETSSAIAASLVPSDGALPPLALLPRYEARVAEPDADGFGVLAVKGPGVIGGYANAPAPLTGDGFFVTGDTAAIVEGGIVVRERTADMFVSGGENVYPAQIRARLLEVSGVVDAHVFGVPDDVWGRRPVAFVERGKAPERDAALLAEAARDHAARTLSRISQPDAVVALSEFPRSGIGKIDRRALERLWGTRIDVRSVRLHRVELPFAVPFETARETLASRTSILVEVRDAQGRTGLGECVAFKTDWYLPETLSDDERVLRDVLVPYVEAEVFAHPRDAYEAFAALPEAAPFPLARAAMENALWDLYGKVVELSFWQLIGGATDKRSEGGEALPAVHAGPVRVPVGAVVGLGAVEETLAQVRVLADEGYRRVKLKVAPGRGDARRVRAVREALPDLAISLDANQSFAESDLPELRELDALGATWIEEPIAFSGKDAQRRDPAAAEARFAVLARLQRGLATPVCLDESFFTIEEARMALAHPELRCFAIKVAKFGGATGALAFVREAHAAGARVWMGGMYDTGVSKRLHAAFETIPGIDDPGDLGTVARYFGRDIAFPPHEAVGGTVALNDPEHPWGIGCELA